MQPGQQEQGGVIYGYRTFGDFGDDANIYYFGRTKVQAVYNMSLEGVPDGVHARQKKMLKSRLRRVGMNAPSRVLLWGRTTNVDRDWDDMKDFLKGHRRRLFNVVQQHPLITNELWVGDNFFTCESHGPEDLGLWVRSVWNLIHEDDVDQQVLVGGGLAEEEEEVQPPVE